MYSDQHIEDLLDQIEDVELRLLKVETLYNGLKSADSHYHREIQDQISAEVDKSTKEMTFLQRELEEQRSLKALKAEYEMLAREINVFESQEIVRAKIEQLEHEIEELQAKSTSEEIILKQKQLHALVSMI